MNEDWVAKEGPLRRQRTENDLWPKRSGQPGFHISRLVNPLIQVLKVWKDCEENQCGWRVTRKRKRRVRWVSKVGAVAPVGLCKPLRDKFIFSARGKEVIGSHMIYLFRPWLHKEWPGRSRETILLAESWQDVMLAVEMVKNSHLGICLTRRAKR